MGSSSGFGGYNASVYTLGWWFLSARSVNGKFDNDSVGRWQCDTCSASAQMILARVGGKSDNNRLGPTSVPVAVGFVTLG